MGDVQELTAREEITGLAVRSTPGSLSSRLADHTDLQPVSRAEFAAELVPCLALTSGVGMSATDQTVWLNAAFKALDGIPIGLLKRGSAAALRKADHPSKIVPSILAEVEESWRGRLRNASSSRPAPRLPVPPTAPVPHHETQRIIREAGLRMTEAADPARPAKVSGRSDRPARVPTREDYIRMGVDPAVLDHPTAEA